MKSLKPPYHSKNRINQKRNFCVVIAVPIVVAIIGAVGVFLAAIINRSGAIEAANKPLEAAQTTEAKQTSIALTSQIHSTTPTVIQTPSFTAMINQTITASISPTSTPTIVTLTPEVISGTEIRLCSSDNNYSAGIRIIARWLLPEGKSGFMFSAMGIYDIRSFSVLGWDKKFEGVVLPWKDVSQSSKCGGGEWYSWWGSQEPQPATSSIISVDFLNIENRIVFTVTLTVEENGITFRRIDYR